MRNPIQLGKDTLSQLRRIEPRLSALERAVDEAKFLAAEQLIRDTRDRGRVEDIHETEFRVFSQFGDDGIIQYLIQRVSDCAPSFVEFGVEDYTESNTRFLLQHDNWRGLVMDSNPDDVAHIRRAPYYWRHDLTAREEMIDRDNIDSILERAGFTGELGLLCIDIDGMDYWVWERLAAVDPTIVVVEYNATFGKTRAVTVPYDAAFQRTKAHYSNLYWGCSLPALYRLGQRKGYALVGCNSAGINAYFVKRDRLGDVEELDVDSAYVPSRFRESRDPEGRLTLLSAAERLGVIQHLPVVDVETDREILLRELTAARGPEQPS